MIAFAAFREDISMKRLLLLACAIASASMVHILCLGVPPVRAEVTMAQADAPGYSRPAAAGLLAQSATGAPSPFITMCLKGCDQEFAACHNRNPNDAGCGAKAQTCKDGCRR
jgi:hypothetical protein